MTLTREHGLWAIVAAVLVAGGVWAARHTEWIDEEVRDPPTGELRRDPDLRLKHVLTKLGVKVAAPGNLDQLPPIGATLVLSSWNWNLFPEREAALRRWVEAGGELVVPSFNFRDKGLGWVPVKAVPFPRAPTPGASQPAARVEPAHDGEDDEDDDSDDAPRKPAAPPASAPAPARPASAPTFDPALAARRGCPGVNEPAGVTPAFDATPRGFSTCMSLGATLQTRAPLLWALDGPLGHVLVRVPLGRGRVTVASAPLPSGNDELLERDNALLTLAALRAQPGREVWLVREEARPPLLAFLWNTGAPAVLLGAAALAFALWRGARRFGPRSATPALARRSMAEQIRGTAAFIAQRGSPALHTAQLRALNETAAPRIRGFDAMILGQRAQAIATLTGLDAHTLAHAMNPSLNATPTRHPAAALALIETARRRLLQATRRPAFPNESR